MGVSLDRIEALFGSGIVRAAKPKVLDIGCSNLHTGTAERLKKFVTDRIGAHDKQALDQWARFAAIGGTMDPEIGGINGLWLGDLLERAGMGYRAGDIFSGYKTETFDLNHQQLEPVDQGAFDVVLNFGTTEHLLGQYNAFKIIHEACSVGGLIYHDVPMTGYLDHGYFCYNPMLFVQLAEANGYDVLQLSLSGSLAGESIERNLLPSYRDIPYFNVGEVGGWMGAVIPTASVSAIFRKLTDAPFRAMLETSTTVGGVSEDIESKYGGDATAIDLRLNAKEMVDALLRSAGEPSLGLDELMAGYNASLASGANIPFPLTLQQLALRVALSTSPEDTVLTERLPVVEAMIREKYPLLRLADTSQPSAQSLRMDGIELDFKMPSNDDDVVTEVVAAYRSYYDRLAIELFPPKLEATVLEVLQRRNPSDKLLLFRLGSILASILPNMVTVQNASEVT